jgi:F0F1-type ATP synthase assembly protein I
MVEANSRRSSTGSDYARYLGIGIVGLVILSILAAIGFFVDNLLGTLPLFLLVGLGIGFAGGLYYLYRAIDELGRG